MGRSEGESPSGSLAGTEWRVEDITGRGVMDFAQTTIRFEPDGRVSGSTGCNHFTGTVEVDGQTLAFGEMAKTLRAGPPALMDQEQRFLHALREAREFAVHDTGLLHVMDRYGQPILRLCPMP